MNDTLRNTSDVNGTSMETDDMSGTYTYADYEYTEFVYMAFEFEHPIYLFIWEILVVISVVIAILFVLTLTRKKLRSVTSYILCAIAISDSLTGLVTLPTYIMVYNKLERAEDYISVDSNETSNASYYYDYQFYNDNGTMNENYELPPSDSYNLKKELCEAFMVSKFFLSKLFHTISIWITVFLGIQRCMSVWMPFTVRSWFSKTKTVVILVTIGLFSPALHVFHVFHDKTPGGFCTWQAEEDCSDGTCVQLWIELIFRHLVPCAILTITTVLMVKKLAASSFQANRSMSVKKFQRGSEVVDDENRQVSRIVLGIVIVFLLTEVPYGLFLLYVAVIQNKETYSLKSNRAIHVAYEITMVLSFNANFVIYMGFNRRFRSEMKRLICCSRKTEVKGNQKSHSQSQSTSQTPGTEISTLSEK